MAGGRNLFAMSRPKPSNHARGSHQPKAGHYIETVPARDKGGGRAAKKDGDRGGLPTDDVYIEADEYLMVRTAIHLWPPGGFPKSFVVPVRFSHCFRSHTQPTKCKASTSSTETVQPGSDQLLPSHRSIAA